MLSFNIVIQSMQGNKNVWILEFLQKQDENCRIHEMIDHLTKK